MAFRNMLAHGYMRVIQTAIERILNENLPLPKAVVKLELGTSCHPSPAAMP
ncbi:MAG: hypothetical protein ACREN8_00105 [Candidatus Dormibacteraceae bacterium]